MAPFINNPAHSALMREFSTEAQRQQDPYENMALGALNPNNWSDPYAEPPVQFSKEQLAAMRDAFKQSDGMYTNGELLLAFPDRQERNEAVTQQYQDLSEGMAGIVGGDNANWATFAVWASDEIGRNLDSSLNRTAEMYGVGDPRYWLSKGNSKLISDIGPAFDHFVDTFGNGRNRDMSFDDYWKSFESAYGGRGISYLDGHVGNADDMKNAFKAYYDAVRASPPADQACLYQAVLGPRGRRVTMARTPEYPFEVRPLSADEGGGCLITFPDFSDCVSDGASVEEAIVNGRRALKETMAALKESGLPVPAPNGGKAASGKFVARVPRSVHAKLASRARAEGVSLNTLVVSLLSEGLGKKAARA